MNNQITERRKLQTSNETTNTAKDNKSVQAKKNEASVRPNKPVTTDSGPGRPPISNIQRAGATEPKMQRKIENNTVTRRPLIGQQDVSEKNVYNLYQICKLRPL